MHILPRSTRKCTAEDGHTDCVSPLFLFQILQRRLNVKPLKNCVAWMSVISALPRPIWRCSGSFQVQRWIRELRMSLFLHVGNRKAMSLVKPRNSFSSVACLCVSIIDAERHCVIPIKCRRVQRLQNGANMKLHYRQARRSEAIKETRASQCPMLEHDWDAAFWGERMCASAVRKLLQHRGDSRKRQREWKHKMHGMFR